MVKHWFSVWTWRGPEQVAISYSPRVHRLVLRPAAPHVAVEDSLRFVSNVKLSLCLIYWVLCHEDIWGSGGIAPPFLTSALDGGDWWASRSCRLVPGEIALGTRWIEGGVGYRFGLGTVENRNIVHCRESKPGLPTRSPSLYLLSYPDCLYFISRLFNDAVSIETI
jgi:hypothetical protein